MNRDNGLNISVLTVYNKIYCQCNTCGNTRRISILAHFFENNPCSICRRKVTDLKSFISYSKKVHGNVFDFSLIDDDTDFSNVKQNVYLRCTSMRCGCINTSTIESHLSGAISCPGCISCAVTLPRFIALASKVQHNRYSYSDVTDIQISTKAAISIECRLCNHICEVSPLAHMKRRYNCPNCLGKYPMDMDSLKELIRKIHQGRYRITNIKSSNTHGVANITIDKIFQRDTVELECIRCLNKWEDEISRCMLYAHCMACTRSHGEQVVEATLLKLNFMFTEEYKLEDVKGPYDFMFTCNNKQYIIEYDGRQHFEYCEQVHKSYQEFNNRISIDINKSIAAILKNYLVIRIDYTQEAMVEYHILSAINELIDGKCIYVSNKSMYKHHLDGINKKIECLN